MYLFTRGIIPAYVCVCVCNFAWARLCWCPCKFKKKSQLLFVEITTMHNTSCGSLMAAIFCTIFYKYRFCTDLFCLSVYLSHRHLYLITHAVRVVCTAEICVSHLYRTHAQQTFSVHVQQLCRRSLGAVEYALLGDLLLPRVYEPPK